MSTQVVAVATIAILTVGLAVVKPADSAGKGVKNIVLVHGAWADGSSFAKIIPLLQAQGYTVTAVQNPLTSLDDDVAATKRVLDLQNGPVLLVGHSWAGTVITQAGNDPKVVGLVYINAFSPDVGQSSNDLGKGYPPPPFLKEVSASNGFLWLSQAGVEQFFAPDLPRTEADIVWSTQGPFAPACLDAKVTAAAWKTKQSWFIVGTRDQMINPDLERAEAKKMNATVLELDSSHVSMLSHPQEVAKFIASAATSL